MKRQACLVAMTCALLVMMSAACGPRPDGVVNGEDGGGEGGVLSMETQVIYELNGETFMGSPAEVFERASEAMDAKENEVCAQLYDAIWRTAAVEYENPEATRYYTASLYNAGLCYEQLEDWDEAAGRYERLVAEVYESEVGLDAVFRLAEVNSSRGRWDAIEANMRRAMQREDLRHLNVVEAHYRLGMSQIALAQLPDAEQTFKKCLRVNRLAAPATIPDRHYLVAGCHYGEALVYHMLFGQVYFQMPEEQMKRDLELKRQLAHKASDQYVRTIRTQNHYWSLLSGYMVGKLHEDFYYDLLSAEIPSELVGDALRGYFDKLREDLLPLIDEAIKVYRKTAATGERLGHDNYWAEAAEQRMIALMTYHDDAERWREEEEALILLYERFRSGELTSEDLAERRFELEPFARPRSAAPAMDDVVNSEEEGDEASANAGGES